MSSSAPHGSGHLDTSWIPLGNAQVVDWKYLGRSASARGATAWLGRVEGEPVLVRTWTSDAATSYEFAFLAHEQLYGMLVITTSRPEPSRLRLEASLEVEGRLGYVDASEFVEHPRTGLHGGTVRTFDVHLGRIAAERIGNLSTHEAEILEYAPESALATQCGRWIQSVLAAVRAELLDGEDGEERSAAPSAAPSAPSPLPVPAAPSRQAVAPTSLPPSSSLRRTREPEPVPAPVMERARPDPVMERPRPEPKLPEPKPAAPEPKRRGLDKLLASTSSGESWELTDAETYIGRSKQCAVVLKSQRVSRKHASITREEDGFFINDLGAANGIWAGTEKIERERIEDGSEYIIGDVLVTFHHG